MGGKWNTSRTTTKGAGRILGQGYKSRILLRGLRMYWFCIEPIGRQKSGHEQFCTPWEVWSEILNHLRTPLDSVTRRNDLNPWHLILRLLSLKKRVARAPTYVARPRSIHW